MNLHCVVTAPEDPEQTPGEIVLEYRYVNGAFQCADRVKVTVVKIDLKEVSFEGDEYHAVRRDDGGQDYLSPHWQDNSYPLDGDADDPTDRKYPVCYIRNSRMKISAKWRIEPSNLGAVLKVCGVGNGGMRFPDTVGSISEGDLTIAEVECSDQFVNAVDILSPLSIAWQVDTMTGISLCPAGESQNQLYVTFADPDTTVFHTLVHIGCTSADGEYTADTIVDSIYSEFTDLDVRRISDNKRLTYWFDDEMGGRETEEILQRSDGNGNCEAWSAFFRDTLRAQGISADRVMALPVSQRDGSILVNTWEFNDPPTGTGTHPYIIGDDAIDLNGVPGQGNANPPGAFNGHWITSYNGCYYDPAYGSAKISGASRDKIYEDSSLAGYGDIIFHGARKNAIDSISPSELEYQIDN